MACTYPSIHFSLDEDTLKITVGCLVCGVCCGGVCVVVLWWCVCVCVVKLGTHSLSLLFSLLPLLFPFLFLSDLSFSLFFFSCSFSFSCSCSCSFSFLFFLLSSLLLTLLFSSLQPTNTAIRSRITLPGNIGIRFVSQSLLSTLATMGRCPYSRRSSWTAAVTPAAVSSTIVVVSPVVSKLPDGVKARAKCPDGSTVTGIRHRNFVL